MGADEHLWRVAERHLGATDPVLAALIARHGPCRLRRDDDLFTGLCDAIVSQQVSVKAANAIFERFRALCPDGITPECVRGLSPETLRAAGLSRAKAAYVCDLAERVADGRLDLAALDALDDDDVIARLTAVKGIGRWTAEMILLFHLGRPDVLPVDDLGLREGFRRAYGLSERPDAATMTAIAEPWRPWRSAGTWYLWRSLNNTPLAGDAPASHKVETL